MRPAFRTFHVCKTSSDMRRDAVRVSQSHRLANVAIVVAVAHVMLDFYHVIFMSWRRLGGLVPADLYCLLFCVHGCVRACVRARLRCQMPLLFYTDR